jgi:GNAT superfamily N-acetyltransferase
VSRPECEENRAVGWQMSDSVEEFLSVAGEFLRAERARNTVLLTVTRTLLTNPTLYGPVLFGWLPGGSGLTGAFMRTGAFPAVLAGVAEAGAAALAGELAERAPDLTGLNAPEDAAWAFARVWQDRTGKAAAVGRRSRLFRLGELTWPSPAPDGAARLATAADRDLLTAWLDSFDADVREARPLDNRRVVEDRLSYGGFTLWEAGGIPVSLAGLTRAADGMVRVGPVYTPPQYRGRSYGGAVTSAVSQAALDAGIAEVLLYTDLANPTSNALYQRLGYRPVEDRIVLAFG